MSRCPSALCFNGLRCQLFFYKGILHDTDSKMEEFKDQLPSEDVSKMKEKIAEVRGIERSWNSSITICLMNVCLFLLTFKI